MACEFHEGFARESKIREFRLQRSDTPRHVLNGASGPHRARVCSDKRRGSSKAKGRGELKPFFLLQWANLDIRNTNHARQSAFCVSPTTAGTIREHHRTPQVGSLSALQIMPNHPASPRTTHQPRGSQRRWSRIQSMGDADLWLAPPNLSAPNAYREYLSSTCGLNAAGNWQPEDTMKCWRHNTCPPEVLSRILSTPAAAFSSCSAQLRAHGCLAVPEQARCGDAPLPQHSHTQRPPLTCHPNNAVGERG